ncbi:uroporphyrinogen decarboxylase [Azospirillum picis]|uniref:Uroporphyrinogen decarboxylase n=2 Tax=Azospirillum picis TaxID=488438 RepID=A0ABU0ML43_9PROT|nr:uroporphyrinogen decarboxylase [Azospirillum picis]MDQ0534177.1 uroporphyrinogen decarboxylase [Azospirillum picis]
MSVTSTSDRKSARKPMLAALAGEACSRPPFWLMRQAGRYLPEYRELRAKAGSFLDLCYNPDFAVEVTLQPLRRYGMDAAILFSDILVVPHALGQPLAYLEGEGPKLDPVRGVEDLKRLSRDRFHETLAPVYETVRRLSTAIPGQTTLIGFAGAPWTIACYMVEGAGSKEYAHVKRWAYGDPAGFAQLIDLIVEVTADYLCRQIEAGAETVQLFDSWAGVLPVGQFRRWVIEPTRQIVARVKAKHPDTPIIGFPRGAGHAYEDYVAGAGVDAVGLDTTVSPVWAARTLQSKLPVQGNLDPIMLAAGGRAMADATWEILEAMTPRPFIFNLGHGVIQSTPPDHVAELTRLLREWPNRG